MKNLHLDDGPLNILCLGAHPDDIEIGCGGTVLEILRKRKDVSVAWVVFAVSKERREEAECAAKHFLKEAAHTEISLHGFEDGYLPYTGGEVKRRFEELKQLPDPDVIFTHWSEDAHQDHRLVSELSWNTFRNHLILEYEIPKYDGDFGRTNAYVSLPGDVLDEKISIVMECHRTQRDKDWFDEDVFRGLARLRGMECHAPEGFAEAFHQRKAMIGLV